MNVCGNSHNINVDNIKIPLAQQTIKFKNITKGTKVEVEKHLVKVLKETIKKVLNFELTDEEFIIVNDALASNDYSIPQKN